MTVTVDNLLIAIGSYQVLFRTCTQMVLIRLIPTTQVEIDRDHLNHLILLRRSIILLSLQI